MTVHTVEQLQAVFVLAHRAEQTVLVLGNGSNMLMSDEGLDGIGIVLDGDFVSTTFDSEGVILGAGVKNVRALSMCKRHGRGGLGSLAGVPGTIGGAIRMNAGTYLGEIGDVVEWVEWFNPADNTVHRSKASELHFTYRKVGLWGAMVLRVRLVTHENDVPAEQESIKAHLARRKATQPLHLPSCGSVFKNPTGDYAGRLIEQVGLKGTQIGQAQISENTPISSSIWVVLRRWMSPNSFSWRVNVSLMKLVLMEPEVRREGRWDENVQILTH